MFRLFVLALFLLSNTSLADISEQDDSLIWGTYRPGLYFGLKPRFPDSLMTGLIWFGTRDFNSFPSEL